MPFEPLNTKISVGELRGNKLVANITLEDAKFWGRPNFSGEMNQFKETSRQFTVLIPNDVADQLRDLGWNVKTTTMRDDEPNPAEWEPTSSLKVKVDEITDNGGSSVHIIMGGGEGAVSEKLTNETMGLLDRSRVIGLDMEIRAWNYNSKEVAAGTEEPAFSARLVTLVAVIEPNILQRKYGALI